MASGDTAPAPAPMLPTAPATPPLTATRTWLLIDVFVLAAAGVQCFVLARDTDRWFAWAVCRPSRRPSSAPATSVRR